MELIQILFLIALWIIPMIFLTNTYLTMNKEEQEAFRGELKRPSILLSLGIPVIGMLILFSGIISTMKLLQHIGATMVFLSWFATSIISWKKRKTGSITSVGLIMFGLIGVIAYRYLI